MALVSGQTLVSKAPSEKCSFTWKIIDFGLIRDSKKILETQNVKFEMGASIGLPTTWKCYLLCKEIEGKIWIGAFVELDKAMTSVKGQKEVLAKLMSMKIGNGKYCNVGAGPMLNMADNPGRGCYKMIPQDEKDDSRVLPLDADGSLSLVVEMVLFNLKAIVPPTVTTRTLSNLESQFEAKFKDTLQRELGNMLKCPDSPSTPTPMMVRVTSSDGKELWINRGILAARSDVFRTMFQTPMSEVQEGLVKIDDISGSSLQSLLYYMYTGALPTEWKDSKIIADFVYGAHKYMLEDLKQFLDQALCFVCSSENCATLLNLANKLDMKTARKELLEVFKGQVKDSSWEEMGRLFKNVDFNAGVL